MYSSIKQWNGLALGCVQLALGCSFNAATYGPAAGNPSGTCPIPAEAQAVDTSRPDHVVGTGTPDSCTGDAVVSAVAAGGVITFNCGPDPVTITLRQTATVTSSSPRVVLDGGGRIALSGDDKVRILYLNTCDPAQNWPASYCQNQTGPELTVQNLTFVDGNTNGQDLNGGGAIFASGGSLKVSRCRFFRNINYDSTWMSGGGAIRVIRQSGGQPVYVVTSTFGGEEGLGNRALAGGALHHRLRAGHDVGPDRGGAARREQAPDGEDATNALGQLAARDASAGAELAAPDVHAGRSGAAVGVGGQRAERGERDGVTGWLVHLHTHRAGAVTQGKGLDVRGAEDQPGVGALGDVPASQPDVEVALAVDRAVAKLRSRAGQAGGPGGDQNRRRPRAGGVRDLQVDHRDALGDRVGSDHADGTHPMGAVHDGAPRVVGAALIGDLQIGDVVSRHVEVPAYMGTHEQVVWPVGVRDDTGEAPGGEPHGRTPGSRGLGCRQGCCTSHGGGALDAQPRQPAARRTLGPSTRRSLGFGETRRYRSRLQPAPRLADIGTHRRVERSSDDAVCAG